MRPAAKKYNTTYKKKVDVERDPYLPKLSPKGNLQCSGCGIFYYRRHWTLVRPPAFSNPISLHRVYCPACQKIKDRYPSGELRLRGLDGEDRTAVLSILRNEEGRARDKNPLERIMSLQAAKTGLRVETTTEKLAQRLGRTVKKARGGKLRYQWGHNNKFVRVIWDHRPS